MKKTAILALTALLAATMLFSACDILVEPFFGDTYEESFICYPDTKVGSSIHIDPDGTETEAATEPRDPYTDLTDEEREIREISDAALAEVYDLPAWEHFRIAVEYGSNGNTNIYVRYDFRLGGYHTYESYHVTLTADKSVKDVYSSSVGKYSCYLRGATAEAFAAAEASLAEQIRPYGQEGSGYYLNIDSEGYLCLACELILPIDGPADSSVGCGDHEHKFFYARICAPDTPEDDTEPETTPAVTTPASDIRTMYGTVVEYEAVEPMEGVIAVQVYTGDGRKTMHLLVKNPSDYCVGDEVVFTYDASLMMESFDGHPVWEAITIDYAPVAVPEKPVIYLYPETPTEVSVKLTLDGKLTCTYPSYDKGWDDFTAHPDGTLVFPDGKQYYCLYWEGIQNMDCDFTRGFCVKGSDTAAFLEWALTEQGLTPREANEFIIYWLPRMEQNPYNVISFQTEAYTEGAVLDIQPNPDSLLRVFMAYYPSDEAVEIEAQSFTPFERVGFAVVEWGGCELAMP